jgi:hypothetical protein
VSSSRFLTAAGVFWARRRWAYGAYMLVALARIPARTRFRLTRPNCDTRLTLENAGLSLTKLPHVVLFALFFFLTVLQFDRIDRRAFVWSLAATAVLGLLVELEEGATRTGNCRLTDVLPDIAGGLVAIGAFVIARIVARYGGARPT